METFLQGLCSIYALAVKLKLKMQIIRSNSVLAISDVITSPILKIKKKCLCCGEEMELYPYVEQDFCDICFPVICREAFNKENDRMTVGEVKEKIRRILIRRNRGLKND